MSRRKVALVMTVGADLSGSNIDSYVNSLLSSIINSNPDCVFLFGSSESVGTVEALKSLYFNKFDDELDYSFTVVDEVDSFDKYFEAFRECVVNLENDGFEVRIDYTLGTKAMTVTAALVSVLYHKDLCFVKSERELGSHVRGSEEVINLNLYKFYDKLILEDIWDLFNNNRFDSALSLLNNLVSANVNKKVYSDFFLAYSYFDKVSHEEALSVFDSSLFVSEFPDLKDRIVSNAKALNIINTKGHKLRCFYVLGSILNNARRRASENKFDDAIARLYRSLELICQIRLNLDYGLVSSDIDINKLDGLDSSYLEELEFKRVSSKIKLSLIDDFVLLEMLGDDLGKFYSENKGLIFNNIYFRNSSILAHGFNYASYDDYLDFEDIVFKAGSILTEDIGLFVEECKFPVFKF